MRSKQTEASSGVISKLADSVDEILLGGGKLATTDQVLAEFGVKNAYILWIWLSMSMGWFLVAMPMMVSAFIMGEPCVTTVTVEPHNQTTSHCIFEEGTLAKEFSLSGSQAYLADMTASAFLFGQVLGASFIPMISDSHGRRLVVLLCLTAMGLIGCISSFAPNIYSFIVLRFLQGSFFNGLGTTPWVLAYESIPMKLRSYTALVFGLVWTLGYCAVGPLAYWLRDWRRLMFAVSSPMLVFAAVYYFTIPESLHFLVSKRNIKKLDKWILKANQAGEYWGTPTTRITGKELCENMDKRKAEEDGESPKLNLFRQLINNRQLMLYTLVFVYLWQGSQSFEDIIGKLIYRSKEERKGYKMYLHSYRTCDNFVYYGLSLFSTQLAGDKYVNFALVALIEVPSYLLSPLLLEKLGRKYFVSLCHLLAAISFFAIIFSGGNANFNLVMWLLGKFAITCAFTGLFVYASEVFPTVVRNGCIGVSNLVAGLGGACAPTVRIMSLVSPILPTIFFGVSAGLAAIFTMALPETKNKELKDSTEEMVAEAHSKRNSA